MKNTILLKEKISSHEYKIKVHLEPENDIQESLIDNYESSEEAKEKIDDHLRFGLAELGEYSLVDFLDYREPIHTLKVLI